MMMRLTRSRIRKVLSEERVDKKSKSPNPLKRQMAMSSSDIHICSASVDIEDSGGWSPRYWRQHLENIRAMRAKNDAPVDSMGASACVDPSASSTQRRLQVLLSLMLSSQTKDQVTSAAMQRLRDHGCSIDQLIEIDPTELGEIIKPVGFWKRKAEYIQATARILKDKYAGEVPSTVDELCQLPGVGPKMAHLVMLLAWNECTGIAVDTHVHRIANRLGWVQTKTTTPEATRKALESWMPKELWDDTNKLLVGFGQQICRSKPKCDRCLNMNMCPYAFQNM